jgi:hypothetical protein
MVITESLMISILEKSVDGLLAYGLPEASEERKTHKMIKQLGVNLSLKPQC